MMNRLDYFRSIIDKMALRMISLINLQLKKDSYDIVELYDILDFAHS